MVLRAPVTFPPEALPGGRLLSGLGTPDIRKTFGTFSYYATDDPQRGDTEMGGKIIEVTFTMGEQTATVVGKAVRVTRLDPFSQEVALSFVQVPPEAIECFYEAVLDGEA